MKLENGSSNVRVYPKIVPFLIQAVGPELNLVSCQSAQMLFSHKPGSRLPYYFVSGNYLGEVGNVYMILQQIYSGETTYQILAELPEFYRRYYRKYFGFYFQNTVYFPPGAQLPSQPWSIARVRPIPSRHPIPNTVGRSYADTLYRAVQIFCTENAILCGV